MKHKKNLMVRIIASFALVAIILGIVGTGILMIFQSISSVQTPELSKEQLQEYIDSLSGATVSGTSDSLGDVSELTGSGS